MLKAKELQESVEKFKRLKQQRHGQANTKAINATNVASLGNYPQKKRKSVNGGATGAEVRKQASHNNIAPKKPGMDYKQSDADYGMM